MIGWPVEDVYHYVHASEEINNPIDNKWTYLQFKTSFCCNIKYMRRFTTLSNLQHTPILLSPSTVPSTTSLTPTMPTPSYSASSPVDLFKKGIKSDPSVYPTLKDELWNDNRPCYFSNLSRAQDVSDVLCANYFPITIAE
jgi:hypothetical protein